MSSPFAPSLLIRPVQAADYPAVTALHNAIFELAWPMTEAALHAHDQRLIATGHLARWVVEVDSAPAGMASYTQAQPPHADRYRLDISVRPEYTHRGLGSALYTHLLRALHGRGARHLRSHARSDRPEGIRFLLARGFIEFLRESDAQLDVTTCDLTPYATLPATLAAQGIRLLALTDLPASPARDHALYALETELRRDVPGFGNDEALTYDAWRVQRLDAPEFLADACFLAVEGDTLVGMSYLTRLSLPGYLRQRLTGVRRSHRGRKIASALKTCGIAYARAHGYHTILTSNAIHNTPMLALNTRLGFVPLPVWVFFQKSLLD